MSVSIRAPKRKQTQARAPSRSSTPNQVVKKEPNSAANDIKDWSIYSLTSAVPEGGSESTRYNVMRFQTSKNFDPAKDLAPPVRLARRDLQEVQMELSTVNNAATVAPLAEKPEYSVAPHGNSAQQRKIFQKKTHEVYQQDESARQLRQEEQFPWLLEDFDGRSVFQGSLEGGQSGTYVFLKKNGNGFDVAPVSKFFKFGSRAKYQTLSLDEAEEKMNKSKSLPRWFMKSSINTAESSANNSAIEAQRQYRMRTTNSAGQNRVKAEEQEEELDYNEDFADDEEQHALVENEEDNKDLEERIKKEMFSANAIGDADPEIENAEEISKARLDKEGRRVQRFLEKLEKNNMYESDTDSNPYGSSSSSDSEEDKNAKNSTNASVKDDEEDKKKSLNRLRDEKIRDQVSKLQNTSVTIYNTPNDSPVISRSHSSSNLSNAKAHAKARRQRPHLVTLRLKSSTLARFADIPSSANGIGKRRGGSDGYDSDRSQKRIRYQSGGAVSPSTLSRATSPMGSRSATASRSATPESPGEEYLITASELASIVRNSPVALTMKGLLQHLKTKLAGDPRNKTRLGGLLKEAGISITDRTLTLRDP